MLDLSKGQSCQATNFIRCLRLLPSAAEANLLEPSSKLSLAKRIERLNVFLLDEINRELSANGNPIVDQLYGFHKQTRRKCVSCGRTALEVSKNRSYHIELAYGFPDRNYELLVIWYFAN